MFRARLEDEYGEVERLALAGEEASRLRKRIEEIARIDFFRAPGRERAERALGRTANAAPTEGGRVEESPMTRATGKTWVTRAGVKVDRIASAWLIRRFIDPAARFKFVPAKGYRPDPGELRFDMYQGEYTHEGDRCTFETLLARFELDDPALAEIGQIVHDVDIKDAKFGRSEAAGIAALVDGLVLAYPDDAERLERGGTIFEGLYAKATASGV
jgi:hypothetical protein